jgi:ABC-type transport system substrate-binding protein
LPYFLESSKWKGNIVSGLEAGLYFYLFNVEAEPYNIPGVREAIAYAIDRQLILDTLFNGEGKVVDCIVVEGVLGHNPGFPKMEYNPQKAKELLAEAGFPDGLACEIIITNDASSSERDMNVAIQGMLKEVGIDLSIRAVDMATYYDMREKGQTPLERMAWWVDYNDPDNFLYTFFSEKKSAHYSVNYFDPEVISLLEAARREVDNDARLKMYQDAEEIIVARDHVAIPMFQVTHTFVLSDRVKNFKVSWNGWSDMPLYEISIQN